MYKACAGHGADERQTQAERQGTVGCSGRPLHGAARTCDRCLRCRLERVELLTQRLQGRHGGAQQLRGHVADARGAGVARCDGDGGDGCGLEHGGGRGRERRGGAAQQLLQGAHGRCDDGCAAALVEALQVPLR